MLLETAKKRRQQRTYITAEGKRRYCRITNRDLVQYVMGQPLRLPFMTPVRNLESDSRQPLRALPFPVLPGGIGQPNERGGSAFIGRSCPAGDLKRKLFITRCISERRRGSRQSAVYEQPTMLGDVLERGRQQAFREHEMPRLGKKEGKVVYEVGKNGVICWVEL